MQKGVCLCGLVNKVKKYLLIDRICACVMFSGNKEVWWSDLFDDDENGL